MTTKPAMSDLSKVSLDDLESYERELAESRARVAAEHKRVRAELDKRYALEAAKAKIAMMGDAELDTLKQAIQAQGIASDEAFGKIGG